MSTPSFIRVRPDHDLLANRAGKDGMVYPGSWDPVRREVGLVFGFDRHNAAQGCECVGPELFSFDELDMEGAE